MNPPQSITHLVGRLPALSWTWLILIAALLFSPVPLPAAPKFWTGNSNGNFNNSANWTPSGVPAAGDDLIFQVNSLVARLLATNDFSPNRAFSSITFQGSNYFIRGSALLITNGITSINASGPNTIDADVEVRASQPWEATGVLGVLDINGDINLNANTLTVRASTGDFLFSGIISGTGSLVKTNVGTLRMDGSGHNTYTGLTRFDGGVLELDKFAIFPSLTNFVSIPGDLVIGDGNGLVGTDVLRLLAEDQIADTSDVTVKNSGLFDLNGHDDRIASLTMQGGTIDSGTGTLILGGNITSLGDTNVAIITGTLSLGGVTRTFDIASGSASPDVRVNATIIPGTIGFTAAGVIKNGAGTIEFRGTNTYNSTTTINDGQLAIIADRGLGTTTTPLGATAGTVINGDANLFLSNVQVTNEALTINAVNTAGDFNASGASIWTGTILLNTNTFIASSGSLLLSGAISGTGGFTKLNLGSLTLGGTNANPYTGTTVVKDGTLLLDKETAVVIDGAMSGSLVIGEDELPENTDSVRYFQCCQLPDDTDITINASGLLDLNGFGENIGDIIFNGGDLDAPSPGSILPTGNITVNRNTNSQAIITGRLSVLSSPIIDVTGHFFSPDLRIDAVLFGGGSITKNGVGELGLTSSNSYSGLTTVNDGHLLVDDSFALGTTSGGTIVNSGAVLALRFDVHVAAEPLTLSGTGQSTFGALSSSFGSNSWAGNITLAADTLITVDSGDFLNLSGSISGAHNLTEGQTGTLMFSGGTANSFSNMIVNSGTLVLAKTIANVSIPGDLTIGDGSGGINADKVRLDLDNQIADSAAINVSSSGLLDLNDQIDSTGAIDAGSSSARIDLGSGTIREGLDNGTATFAGVILGTGTMFKLGSGTWTLTGNNTYSGNTTVSAGTLVVDGSQPQSAVTVNGTANLMGNGTIGNLSVLGSLRPGSSPGMLTCSNVAFSAAGDYFVELNGSTPGTGFDQLNVRGTNQLGSSTLHVSVGSGFAPQEGDSLTIINNDGSEAIQGTFSGLPNGSLLTAGGLQFRILYSDIFLNDVILVVTNTALQLGGTPIITTGNGDADIEPNECNLLFISLSNIVAGTVSGVSATLSSTNPAVVVTQPLSTYPNLPANGTRTNSTPFQISTSPTVGCGTNLDLLLTVTTATNGSFTVPVRLITGTGGAVQRFNRTGDQAIADLSTLDSTIMVSGILTPLHHLTVSLHLSHTVDQDLDISLIAPDGTTVNLSSDNGGTLDDYGTSCADADRTTFSDTGSTAITAGTAPFVGTFRPEQPLSVYRGKFGADVNGTWRLRITDDTAGGLGTLHCWSLLLSPSVCPPGGGECEQCGGPIVASINNTDLLETGRLTRDTTNSECALAKACPGLFDIVPRHYDAHTFTNIGAASCVTVTLTAGCGSAGNAVFSAAYLGSFNPGSLCLNYAADAGESIAQGSESYSFIVPAKTNFVVVVHELNQNSGCTNYSLQVNGFECPQALAIAPDPSNAGNVIVKWSTSAVGYDLLATNSLNGPPSGFTPVGPAPVVLGSKYTVTNTASGSARFYKLRKP